LLVRHKVGGLREVLVQPTVSILTHVLSEQGGWINRISNVEGS